jgi:hypothetical protein
MSERLSTDTVNLMHQKFMEGIETKALQAVPADAADREAVVDSLKRLLIACKRKSIEVKPDHLADIARSGIEGIEEQIKQAQATVNTKAPKSEDYKPSPRLDDDQEQQIAKAATKREENPDVQKLFGAEDRIYLRLKGAEKTSVSDIQQQIAAHLEDLRYTITDYNKGYARKTEDTAGKQSFRIGKILKENDGLFLDEFINDSSRTLGTMIAVISRNPEDIANMSTGRAWVSCTGSRGVHWKSVPKEVQHGCLVAYMAPENDPDILSPLARMMIKPLTEKRGIMTSLAEKFFKKSKPEERLQIFLPDKTYGLKNAAFSEAITKFVEENLNAGKDGDFKFTRKLYRYGYDSEIPRAQTRQGGEIIKTKM